MKNSFACLLSFLAVLSLTNGSSLVKANFDGNLTAEALKTIFNFDEATIRMNLSLKSITSITDGAFSQFISLASIDLSVNQVSDINSKTFGGLGLLQSLELYNNPIATLKEKAFDDLPELTSIGLQSTKVSEIKPNAFSKLPKLAKLNLQNNGIYIIDGSEFDVLPGLIELNLAFNPISVLQLGALSAQLPALERLFLARSTLSSLDVSTANFANLIILDVTLNKLDRFEPSLLGKMPKLRALLLSGNKIGIVPTPFGSQKAFANHDIIERIDLKSNEIAGLSDKTFSNLSSLNYIRLASNSLMRLNPGAFDNIPELNTLDASDNVIAEITGDLFAKVPNLARLVLSMNKLTSIPAGLFANVKYLNSLSLEANELAQVSLDTFNKDITCLTTLSLAGNPISSNLEEYTDASGCIKLKCKNTGSTAGLCVATDESSTSVSTTSARSSSGSTPSPVSSSSKSPATTSGSRPALQIRSSWSAYMMAGLAALSWL